MNLEQTEYRNDPKRFSELQRKLLLRSAVFVSTILVFSVVIFFFAGDRDFAGGVSIPIIYLLFILAVLYFSVYRNLKRQKIIYDSYKIVISEQSIAREQSNLPPVTISLNSVKEVKQNAWGNLEIKGNSPKEVIVISSLTEHFDDLKSWLEKRFSIAIQKGKGPLMNYLVMIGAIGTMLIFFEVQNKVSVVITGTILLVTLTWSIYKIQTTAMVDQRTKRLSWWSIVVIVGVAASMYFRIFPISYDS